MKLIRMRRFDPSILLRAGCAHCRHAFTLIELLLAVGIVGSLSAITISAVNPFRQLGQGRDAQRQHTARQFERAMFQHLIDNTVYPGDRTIPSGAASAIQICRAMQTDFNCVNIDGIAPQYIACIPYDGHETNRRYTGYRIYLDTGRVQVRPIYLGSGSLVGGCEAPPSPIAYWKLDESGMNDVFRDSSGLGHHATPTGGFAPPHGPSARIPSVRFRDPASRYFDGTNDYATLSTTTILNLNRQFSFTAWAWIESPLTEDKEMFMRSNNSGSNELNFAIEDTGVLAVHVDGTRYESATVVPRDRWVHLAGVRNGSNVYVYIDGVLNATRYAGSRSTNFEACTTMFFAADVDSTCTTPVDNHWRGWLDEVRIYNVALTGSSIALLAGGNP